MSMARVLAALALAVSASALAQQKEIKIGFIYDVTGPFAGGGSEPAQIGTKAAVDYFRQAGFTAVHELADGMAGWRGQRSFDPAPISGPAPWLVDNVDRLKLNVDQVVHIHGGVDPYSAVLKAAGRL